MPDAEIGGVETRDILGLRVTSGSASLIVADICARISRRQSTRIAFLNAHLSNICGEHPEVKRDLDGFLLLNDGIGLDIASVVLHGRRFPANLNGTDLTSALLDQKGHGWRIFCLGARADVVVRASATIARRWPAHTVVGHRDGYFTDDTALRREIAALQPDLVIVAMGNPIQERWIRQNIPEVCPTAIAVGAWFDFLVGAVPRAPLLLRNLRLEWLFRLLIEPKRLASRYLLGIPHFLARVAWARLSTLVRPGPGPEIL